MFGRKKETIISDGGNTKKTYITRASGATKMKEVKYSTTGPKGKTVTIEKQSAPNKLIQSKKRVVRVNNRNETPYKKSVERQISINNVPILRNYKFKK